MHSTLVRAWRASAHTGSPSRACERMPVAWGCVALRGSHTRFDCSPPTPAQGLPEPQPPHQPLPATHKVHQRTWPQLPLRLTVSASCVSCVEAPSSLHTTGAPSSSIVRLRALSWCSTGSTPCQGSMSPSPLQQAAWCLSGEGGASKQHGMRASATDVCGEGARQHVQE